MLVAPPNYFPWATIWIAVFFVIYLYRWKLASWRKRCIISLAFLFVSTALLTPFQYWGTYHLNGIWNGGLFHSGFGYWEDTVLLPPETTYKSETLSNRYTLDPILLEISSDEVVVFYLLDENFPEIRHAEHNSSELGSWLASGTFILPYYYSEPNIVANWTMNVFNPSLNTTADVSLFIYGGEDFGTGSVYYCIQYHEPTRGIVSLWLTALIATPIAYYYYRRRCT
ncbi:MAG: hypothetical protein ACFFBL_13720 [Promethearchaeota archaeon]